MYWTTLLEKTIHRDPSSYSDLRESNSLSVLSVSHGILLGFIKAAKTGSRQRLKAVPTLSVMCLFSCVWTIKRRLCAYIELFEDGVFFYPREHDSHGVGTILQERNLHSVHVVGEFLDVRLQLCKGWKTVQQCII